MTASKYHKYSIEQDGIQISWYYNTEAGMAYTDFQYMTGAIDHELLELLDITDRDSPKVLGSHFNPSKLVTRAS